MKLSRTQVFVLRNIRRAHLDSAPRSWRRTIAALQRRGLIEHHGWAHGWERTKGGDEALDAVRLAEGDKSNALETSDTSGSVPAEETTQ